MRARSFPGSRYFCERFFGNPLPEKSAKITRPLMPSAAPIRPLRLVSTQQGVETLAPQDLTPCRDALQIGSEEAEASVCPQNRAYGSVHGSSRKTNPLRNIKPMCQLSVGSYFLSHQIDKPTVRISSCHRAACGERPSFLVGIYRLSRLFS